MIEILIYFFLGFSLSMDAFTVTLSIGILNKNKKLFFSIVLLIGIFHFIMPIIGYFLGLILEKVIIINYLSSCIFIIIAIEMFVNRNEEINLRFSLITSILLAFFVSLDSLTAGLALGLEKENIILSSSIISLCSIILSILGFVLGNRFISKQKYSTYLAIILMLIVSIKFLFLK